MSLQISTSSHDFGSGHSGGSGDLPGGRESRLATMFRQPPIADRPGRPPGRRRLSRPLRRPLRGDGLYRQRLLDRPVAPAKMAKNRIRIDPGKASIAPCSSGRRGLTGPLLSLVRVTLPGSLTRSTLRLLNAHGGVFNIFLAPSVTRSLSAILLSPFEFPRSSQRPRGRTGNQEGEVSDPPFFVLRTSRQARPCNTPCNTPLPCGGVAHFSHLSLREGPDEDPQAGRP